MRRIVLICEPLAFGASVQFELVKLVTKALNKDFHVTVISPHIPEVKHEKLMEIPNIEVVSLSERKRLLKYIYHMVERNEAALWGISWIMEAIFKANSSLLSCADNGYNQDYTVNMAYTAPAKSSLYWNLATPLLITLRMMTANPLAGIVSRLFGPIIELLDQKIRKFHKLHSKKIAHNSNYLMNLYAGQDLHSDIVISTPKEFEPYEYRDENRSRDYVLAYIGKEVEVDTLMKLTQLGIRIVSFGAKIPFGIQLNRVRDKLGFMGYVDDEKLSELYGNALFTAFPFTEEPFGWVPLESMYRGTPVLSYNKQGPSETIIHERTGWLTDNEDEFVKMAAKLWTTREISISSVDCVNRALDFSIESIRQKLISVLQSDKYW